MLPYEVNGLPLHILLVHVVVIVLPAAALLTVLGAAWPAFRRKLGVLTPIVALIGLLSVPLATNAGEWLLDRVNPTPLIQAHVALGDTLLPWAVGQFLVATAIWVWYRWFAAARSRLSAPGRADSGSDRTVPAGFGTPGRSATATARGASTSTGAGNSDPELAPDGTVLLRGEDPFAPTSGSHPATPGIRPTAPPRARAGRTASIIVSIVAIVVALVVSTGTVVKVVQIGESGSNAVWQGSFSPDPVEG